MQRQIDNVLVVDDEEMCVRAVGRLLTQHGFKPISAASVTEATAQLAPGHRVDLVISDYQLGDGTACDVLEAVLAARPIPLMIVMSGKDLGPDGFLLGSAGVAACLPKPINWDDLLATIDRVRALEPLKLPPLMLVSRLRGMSVRDIAGSIRDVLTEQALALAKGNKTAAAQLLGIRRQSIILPDGNGGEGGSCS